MNDTFSVNISSNSEISAVVGSNISLLCEATMDASLSWFFNGLPIKVSMSLVQNMTQKALHCVTSSLQNTKISNFQQIFLQPDGRTQQNPHLS